MPSRQAVPLWVIRAAQRPCLRLRGVERNRCCGVASTEDREDGGLLRPAATPRRRAPPASTAPTQPAERLAGRVARWRPTRDKGLLRPPVWRLVPGGALQWQCACGPAP